MVNPQEQVVRRESFEIVLMQMIRYVLIGPGGHAGLLGHPDPWPATRIRVSLDIRYLTRGRS